MLFNEKKYSSAYLQCLRKPNMQSITPRKKSHTKTHTNWFLTFFLRKKKTLSGVEGTIYGCETSDNIKFLRSTLLNCLSCFKQDVKSKIMPNKINKTKQSSTTNKEHN